MGYGTVNVGYPLNAYTKDEVYNKSEIDKKIQDEENARGSKDNQILAECDSIWGEINHVIHPEISDLQEQDSALAERCDSIDGSIAIVQTNTNVELTSIRDDMKKLQNNKQNEISDSGWQYLTFGANFDPNGSNAMYRKWGDIVDIRMSLKCKVTANTNDKWYLAIQDLPSAIRPDQHQIIQIPFHGIYNESKDVLLLVTGNTIYFRTERIEAGNYLEAHITYML